MSPAVPPPAWRCQDCDGLATAAWGATRQASRPCCPAHDPLTARRFTGEIPPGFWYHTLGLAAGAAPHTTGYPGAASARLP